MNRTRKALLAAVALTATTWGGLALAAGDPPPRKEQVTFAKGASSATIKGTIKGHTDIDYHLRAAAGQTLEVKLQGSNSQNEFNVLVPGSANVAMYSSMMTGERSFKAVLPTDGDYVIRVYLNRAAARRTESSQYTLTVGVTGKPLPPLPAARDAKVAGTAYHATAEVKCVPPYATTPAMCPVGVIRRGTDGTATVELRNNDALVRRILFVQGKPVAADTGEPLVAQRQGDVTVVKVGADERYDIPDPLLTGG